MERERKKTRIQEWNRKRREEKRTKRVCSTGDSNDRTDTVEHAKSLLGVWRVKGDGVWGVGCQDPPQRAGLPPAGS